MRFRNEYYFLSNMYPCSVPMYINGSHYTFRCAESAFQAAKDPKRAAKFEKLDGYAAKKLGRKVALRPDWEDVKDNWMRTVLRVKFTDPALAARLVAIKGHIAEDNTWGDRCWGVCDGTGENRLGKLLMELRDELARPTDRHSNQEKEA